MTREQVKELLPIIQAFAEGKEIEVKPKEGSRWCKFEDNDIHLLLEFEKCDFRIKPQYRPFKDAKECWNEMLKHQPFGFVKYKEDNIYSFISKVDKNSCYFAVNEYWAFDTIFKNYTFADGTTFGIKEE